MTLERCLKRAVENGLLTLSFNRSWDGSEWVVTYRNTDNTKVNIVNDPDLVKAIEKAVRPPRSPSRTKPKAQVGKKPVTKDEPNSFEDLLG